MEHVAGFFVCLTLPRLIGLYRMRVLLPVFFTLKLEIILFVASYVQSCWLLLVLLILKAVHIGQTMNKFVYWMYSSTDILNTHIYIYIYKYMYL